MSGMLLKSANAPEPATAGAAAQFQRRYGLSRGAGTTSLPQPNQPGEIQASQQSEFVAGKSFYKNGDQWIDSAIQKASSNAGHIRIQFGSVDYFELVRKQPQTAPWLALGPEVQFVFSGTVYEIYQ
jgi:hypothetical protein